MSDRSRQWRIAILLASFLMLARLAHAHDAIVFLDDGPLTIHIVDGYVVGPVVVFVQNTASTTATIDFVIQVEDARGPLRIEVTTPDHQTLAAGEVRAFRLELFPTGKERMARTGLVSSGFLVASGGAAMKAATRRISFYTTPEVLIGHRRFWIPGLIAFLFIIVSVVWARFRAVTLRARMKDVKLDLKESWLSNVGAATTILNIVLASGTLSHDLKPEITTLTGLFGLLIVTGPLLYNLTLSVSDEGTTGPVWAFIVACGVTLMGASGALETAYVIFDHFAQSGVISRVTFAFYVALLLLLVFVIVLFAIRTAHRTILSRVVGAKRAPDTTTKEHGSLL